MLYLLEQGCYCVNQRNILSSQTKGRCGKSIYFFVVGKIIMTPLSGE